MAGRILELALAIKGKVDASIPQSLRQVSSSMQDLEKKAASLRAATRNTSAWTKQAQSVRELAKELRQAQSQVQAAATALRQSGGSSQGAQEAYNQAQKRVKQLSSALNENRNKLHQVSAALQEAGFDTEHFAESQQNLQNSIERTNRVLGQRRKLKSAQSKQDVAGERLSNANINLQSGIDIGQTLATPLIEATQNAVQFESVMADVRKVVVFESPQQFKDMGNDILAMSQTLPMAAEDIGKIVAAGGQSGIARDELMSFAESAVKMGVAFDVTADQAGDMMAKWRTAFGMNQTEVVALADKINYLSNTTAASAPIISDIVTRVGPLGDVGGVASGEIAALGASMAGVGIPADVAATGIKNLILGMSTGASATKTQADAFTKLGFSAEEMATRMQTDAKGAILDVLQAIQALPKEQQAGMLKDLFGSESINAIAPLLSNLDNLKGNLDKVSDSTQYAGSMEAEYATRSKTTANQIQLMKNSVHALSIGVGNALLPAIGAVASAVAPVLQSFAQWASHNQTMVAALAGIAAAVGGVIVALLGISVAVSAFQYIAASMKALRAGILLVKGAMMSAGIATRAFAAAQAFLNAVMSANPLALAIIAIVALAAALVYLWNTSKTFRTAVINAWNQIKDAAIQVWNAIAPYIEAAWSTIKSVVSAGISFLKGIWAGIAPYATAAFDVIVSALSTAVGIISTAISAIIQVIAVAIPIIAAIFGVIGTIISTAFSIIVPIVTTIFNIITTVIGAAIIVIKTIIVGLAFIIAGIMWEIASVVMAVWGFIGPFVMGVINGIIAVMQIFGTIASLILNLLLSIATTVWNTILSVATAVWGAIGPYVMAVIQTIVAVIQAAGAVISSIWDFIYSTAFSAWNAIVDVVNGVIDSVIGIVKQGVDAVESAWSHLKDILSAPITAVVNFVKGGDPSAQSAAGASAEGGVFRHPYLTWVAEAGDPEVIVPINRTSRAMSLWQTAGQMLGALPTGTPTTIQPMPGAAGTTVTQAPLAMEPPTTRTNVTFEFKPVITVNGRAGNVSEQIRAALAQQAQEFEAQLPRMLERARARERRLSFD